MSVQIITGDCRDVLKTLPDQSVHCVVTSPPYFGLRDYGIAEQIGLEQTPDAFVAELVAVFREARRVLRDDGTLWLNLGDSYWTAKGASMGVDPKQPARRGWVRPQDRPAPVGLKGKDLIGIPWRVAFALQADGWYLRQDIIWHKPNPMPESVQDRCTKAHEYIFLLSKSDRYHFDAAAIAEASCKGDAGSSFDTGKTAGHQSGRLATGERAQSRRARELAEKAGLTDKHIAAIRSVGVTDVGKAQVTQSGFGKNTADVIALASEAKAVLGGYYREFLISDTRNKRSVWEVATMPYSGAHFATFPPALIEPCILAGCPVGGTVLDPFGGAGTTAMVADRLQRNAITIELNPEYVAIQRERLAADAGMFAEVA